MAAKTSAFIATVFASLFAYLLLTAGTGSLLGLWSPYEIVVGVTLSLAIGVVTRNSSNPRDLRMLNPFRWALFLVYLVGPFFVAMAKANIDVAYRVITGRIRPGIVRISPNYRTDLATTLLANSITLTPGTLTVDVDEKTNDLYVHWINVRRLPADIKDVCGSFPDWIRRIAE